MDLPSRRAAGCGRRARCAIATATSRTALPPTRSRRRLAQGSYFENLTGRSSRLEGTAELYLPPRHWAGEHNLRMGVDLDHVNYNQNQMRAPVNYLRENGTLIRQSTFPQRPPSRCTTTRSAPMAKTAGGLSTACSSSRGCASTGTPSFAARCWVRASPPCMRRLMRGGTTKFSAGIGLYYESTPSSPILIQPFAGIRYDTYYAADGTTPSGPPQETVFTANDASLHDPRASTGASASSASCPGTSTAVSIICRRSRPTCSPSPTRAARPRSPAITPSPTRRLDHYRQEEFDLRRLFGNGYTVYVAYTHSSARTNAALDYLPTPSPLGPQQPGPQPWDAPNRTISWGWLPFDVPWFKKNWDFVYTLTWQSGFPYTAVNATDQVVGAAGAYRFPDYINFSPGLEWRFHFRGEYYGLRGVIENATDSQNPGHRQQQHRLAPVRHLHRARGPRADRAHPPDRTR